MDDFPYVVGPGLTSTVVCDLITAAGINLPAARLRSWHALEGLSLGRGDTGWRRYDDFEVVAIAALCALSNHGLAAGELVQALSPGVRQVFDWVVRSTAGEVSREDFIPFLAAYRGSDGRLRLHAASLAQALEGDPASPAAEGIPATVLNLNGLADRLRAASLDSEKWRAALARQKGSERCLSTRL